MLVLAMLTLRTRARDRNPGPVIDNPSAAEPAPAPTATPLPRPVGQVAIFARRETMTTNVSRINECDGYGYTTICGLSRCDPWGFAQVWVVGQKKPPSAEHDAQGGEGVADVGGWLE